MWNEDPLHVVEEEPEEYRSGTKLYIEENHTQYYKLFNIFSEFFTHCVLATEGSPCIAVG